MQKMTGVLLGSSLALLSVMWGMLVFGVRAARSRLQIARAGVSSRSTALRAAGANVVSARRA
jgi:hypothetical protein